MTVVVNVIQQSDEFTINHRQTDATTTRQLQNYNYDNSDTNNNIAVEEEEELDEEVDHDDEEVEEEELEEEEQEETLHYQTKHATIMMTMTTACNDKNDEMTNLTKNAKINPNTSNNNYKEEEEEEKRKENLLKHGKHEKQHDDDNNNNDNGFPYAPPPPPPPLLQSVGRLSPSRVDDSVEIHHPEPAPLMLLFDNNESTEIVHCECTVESLLLIKQQQQHKLTSGGGSNPCAGRRSRKAASSCSANGAVIKLCDSKIACKCRRYTEQCHSGCACARPSLTTPDDVPQFQNDHHRTNPPPQPPPPLSRCYYSNNVGDNYVDDDDYDNGGSNYDYDDDINHCYRGEKRRQKSSLPKVCCSNRMPMLANENMCYTLSLDDNNPTVNHTGQQHHPQQHHHQQQQQLNELETTSIVKPNQLDIKCKCRHGSGKKRCLDSSKCACRRVFKVCDQQNCKCTANCANFVADPTHRDAIIAQHALNEQVQKWFMEPHRGASRVMVVKLVSDQQIYTADYFVGDSKEPRQHVEQIFYTELMNAVDQCRMTTLRQICLFMPTSPCFHQDCEPQCDVLDRCQSSRACAETLAIAYKQLQQRLNNSDLQMTVKFLASYVRRGDLYTKQGILCMLQAGISVEPLNRKDWQALVESDDQQRSRHSRNLLWDSLGLTNYAMQSQFYINECRQELGLRQLYWHSALHTLLRDCAVAGTRCCRNFGQIRRQFSHEQSRGDFERARRRHRSSLNLVHLRSQSVESSLSRCSRFNNTNTNTTNNNNNSFQQQQQHNFQNIQDPSSTALLVDSAWTRSSNECDSSSLLTSNLQQKQQQQHRSHHTLLQNSNTPAPSCSILPSYCSSAALIWPTDQTSISQLIDNLQGRCIDELEAQEINTEVMKAIDEIQLKIADLLTYLHRTIDSTAL